MKTVSSVSTPPDHVVLESTYVSFDISPHSIDKPWLSSGRFGRLSFLAWAFIYALLLMPLIVGILYWREGLSLSTFPWHNLPAHVHSSTYLLLSIPVLLLVYLLFTAGARRFHDLGFSSFWALLMFIPIVNVPVGLYMILIQGNNGMNQYGFERATPIWEAILGLACIAFKLAAWALIFSHFHPVMGIPV